LSTTTYTFTTAGGFGPTITSTGKNHYALNIGYCADPAGGLDGYRGPFRYNSGSGKGQAIVAISDGTSNTIGFAETVGGLTFIGDATNEGWTMNPVGHSFFAANFWACPNGQNGNCAPNSVSPPNANTPITRGKGLGSGIPGSFHNGRYMCVFMDGSVRSLDGGIAFGVYAAICGASDGQVVTFDN